nr:putative ulp1 protease family, C-terminal catalytic domain-containing protein [Ipomoea batatas]
MDIYFCPAFCFFCFHYGSVLTPFSHVQFIFPILQNEHYYVISFDMVRKRIDIIDNISVTMTNVAKYGSVPEVLRDFVSVFLDDMVDERYGFAVRRITPRRMQMHWRDVNNKVDCGVFAMRHMETFLGQSVKSWDCGLRKGDRKGLESLRVSYMRQILAAELNVHHSNNIRCAVDFRDAVGQN